MRYHCLARYGHRVYTGREHVLLTFINRVVAERSLNFNAILKLNAALPLRYARWIATAPPSYKSFFGTRRLAIITCRYGQNAVVDTRLNVQDQSEAFGRLHRWSEMRWVSLAIASDIRYAYPISSLASVISLIASLRFPSAHHAHAWTTIPPADIRRRNTRIYDSPDLTTRSEILVNDNGHDTLLDLPLLNSDGKPVRIYSAARWEIPRRTPTFDPNATLGILADLTQMDSFFCDLTNLDTDTNILFIDPSTSRSQRAKEPAVRVYPQAGTRLYGHVQSDALPFRAASYLNTIINVVAAPVDTPEDPPAPSVASSASSLDVPLRRATRSQSRRAQTPASSTRSSAAPSAPPPPPIRPDCVQMYNLFMHRSRNKQSTHDAQSGAATAMLCMALLNTRQEHTAWNNVKTKTGEVLPHQNFTTKRLGATIDRDFRMEAVYHLDIPRFKDDIVTPEYVLQFTLCCLMCSYLPLQSYLSVHRRSTHDDMEQSGDMGPIASKTDLSQA